MYGKMLAVALFNQKIKVIELIMCCLCSGRVMDVALLLGVKEKIKRDLIWENEDVTYYYLVILRQKNHKDNSFSLKKALWE